MPLRVKAVVGHYQSIGSLSRKNPPVGLLSGSVASQTIVSAPCSVVRGAFCPPISVLTQPGQTAFTRIFLSLSSSAKIRVNAFNAVFDIR